MKVLVLNCGSSSIKYQLFDMPEGEVVARGMVQRIGEKNPVANQTCGDKVIELKETVDNHDQGLMVIEKMLTDKQNGPLKSLAEIKACGHRVVHGGEKFTVSVLLNDEIESVIDDYIDLAPLHNPANLAGIRAVKKTLPGIPQVACFDTAFHQTMPATAYLYALPYEMYEKFKIRKYGFHGISHRYVARRAAELMNKQKYEVDLITCHLGNGCSIAAIKNGRSVDTSMGLTPLEGLVMGTRSGDLDAAIVFHLKRKGYELEAQEKMFNKQSGLLGISGVSNDMRDLESAAARGNQRAKLALEIFAYKIKKYIGMYFGVLNGCDAIVFTGGIGENDFLIRKLILEKMENLNIKLDDRKNDAAVKQEMAIQAEDSGVKIFVIPTNEEKAIARDTFDLVQNQPGKA